MQDHLFARLHSDQLIPCFRAFAAIDDALQGNDCLIHEHVVLISGFEQIRQLRDDLLDALLFSMAT